MAHLGACPGPLGLGPFECQSPISCGRLLGRDCGCMSRGIRHHPCLHRAIVCSVGPWVLFAVASRRVAGEAVVVHDASMGRRVQVIASPDGVSQLLCLLGPPKGHLSVLGCCSYSSPVVKEVGGEGSSVS